MVQVRPEVCQERCCRGGFMAPLAATGEGGGEDARIKLVRCDNDHNTLLCAGWPRKKVG